MHRAREKRVVLVVHRHDDEQLRPAGRVIMYLAQREAVVLEVVRVARRGRIAHMCELALVFVGAEVEQFRRHGRVEHEVAMEEPANAQGEVVSGKRRKNTHSTRLRVLLRRGTRCGIRP